MSNGMWAYAQGVRRLGLSSLSTFLRLGTRNLGLLKRTLFQDLPPKFDAKFFGFIVLAALGHNQSAIADVQWFDSGGAAYQACVLMQKMRSYPEACNYHAVSPNDRPRLGDFYYSSTGFLCEHPSLNNYPWGCIGTTYYGQFFVRTNCPAGQSPNRRSGTCEYSHKNYDSCGVGNPVKPGTGSKQQNEYDFLHSVMLQFTRSYNSVISTSNGHMGVAWINNFARAIVLESYGAWLHAHRADGKVQIFNLNLSQGGTWDADQDVSDYLVELKDTNGVRTGWRYTVAADDSIETYTAAGKLLSIADRTGRTQTLVYDVSVANGGDDDPDTLDTVTDDAGRQLVFTYDTNKRIATLTDPAGGIITYGYDAQSNLVSVQYPDGRSKTYHYNEPEHTGGANLPHALTGITDENGDRYATYQYQADGRAIATGHAGGADLHTLTYNPDGSTTVTDPLGTQRTHNFTTILGVVKSTGQSQPGGSGCGPASSATTYDANGNVKSRADFNGNKTCYAWDLTRNLETARVEGLASGASCPADPTTYTPTPNTAERKILTQWHPTFRLPVKITEAGRETSTAYDSRGNITSRSIKDTATNETRTWTTAYTYHATVPGVLVQKVDNGPRTDVPDITTTDYYAPDENCPGGYFGCRSQVRQITNALGHVTTYDEYDAHGRVTRLTDPNSLVTTLAYTPRGWLQSRTVGTETTTFDYDGVGQLTRLTRPDGSYVEFAYDAAHRLTDIIQQDGARLTYTLDPAGNRIKEEITGPGSSYIYYTHRREFDALGRLWKDIGAYNQTITYEYDAAGNLKQIDGARTDVADLTRHTYDPLDRLTQTLNADGGLEKSTPNALDHTTKIVDPANQTTTQTVNAFGDITTTVSADTGTTVRTYDLAGNLKTEKDARNITVTYSYDALNRLTQKQSSASGSPVWTFDYDYCRKGQLCMSLSNGTFDTYHTYDPLGRPQYRLQNTSGSSISFVYTAQLRDSAGRINQLIYPTGRTVTYAYDAQGRISQVSTRKTASDPDTVLAENFIYGYPFAGPLSFDYGNGTSFYQSLDQDYRPWIGVDGPRIKMYNYDAASNLAALWDWNNSQITYAYDATGRLVSALDTAPSSYGSLAWTYDPNGNRQSETRNAGTMPYVYSPTGSNGLFQTGSTSRYKTANGNTASIGTTTFTYDGFNRLATAQTAAETTTYTYNALGERIRKVNQNGLATVFHYGPDGKLLYERDQAGNTKEYVWLGQRPLARIDNQTSIYTYHVDHLGTPQMMTDPSGTTVWRADYEPFGKASVRASSTVENNLRFPGQYFDRETGMHYNYYRSAYNPGTGRYEEADPIGLEGGLNIYAYVEGNPLSAIDPEGLMGRSGKNGGAVWGELASTYHEMGEKDVPGTDQFFHCLAACRATKKSGFPDAVRQVLDAKEDYWDYPRGRLGLYGKRKFHSHDEMLKDNNADKSANEYGIVCPPEENCEKRCAPFLDGLPPKYRPFMRKYRENW